MLLARCRGVIVVDVLLPRQVLLLSYGFPKVMFTIDDWRTCVLETVIDLIAVVNHYHSIAAVLVYNTSSSSYVLLVVSKRCPS